MMFASRRWPLLVDPQSQALSFIKSLGLGTQGVANGFEIIRQVPRVYVHVWQSYVGVSVYLRVHSPPVVQSDKKFQFQLEMGVRHGKWIVVENVSERLDAALEPLLQNQKYTQGGVEVINISDHVVPYNPGFQLFLTTRLANPHFPPELCAKVSVLNFCVTPDGLQDQMLGTFVVRMICVLENSLLFRCDSHCGVVVNGDRVVHLRARLQSTDMPDIEERKAVLTQANIGMQRALADIEARILSLLSASEGDVLDDDDLVQTLSQAKVTAQTLSAKVAECEGTQQELNATRNLYVGVAARAAALFFCIGDLAAIDPMYQFSLSWCGSLPPVCECCSCEFAVDCW